jgi:hypothetical protein
MKKNNFANRRALPLHRSTRRAMRERICFVHLPKSAGTTVRHAIENFFDEADILRLPDGPVGFTDAVAFSGGHESWFISGHFPYCLADRLQGDSTTIYISRDPVERFFSTYWFWKSLSADIELSGASKRLFSLARKYGPDAFLDALLDSPEMLNFSTLGESLRVLGQQSIETGDCSFETAATNLRRASFVLTVEEVSRSLPKLLRNLGLASSGSIPALNRTPPYPTDIRLRSRLERATEEELLLHQLASTLEAQWVRASTSPSRAPKHLAHKFDPGVSASLEIPARGPFFGTGVLPCESEHRDEGPVFWRRFVADGLTLNFVVKHSVELFVEIRILTGVFSHVTERLLVKINDAVVPSCVAVFEGRGIIAVDAGSIAAGRMNRLEVTVQTSSQDRAAEFTLGFSSIRIVAGKLPSLAEIEDAVRRAEVQERRTRTYCAAVLSELQRKEEEIRALVATGDQQRVQAETYCAALLSGLEKKQQEIRALTASGEQQRADAQTYCAALLSDLEKKQQEIRALTASGEQQRADAQTYCAALLSDLEKKQQEIRALMTCSEQQRAEAQTYCAALRDQAVRAETYCGVLLSDLEKKQGEIRALSATREQERIESETYCAALREQAARAESYSAALLSDLEKKQEEIRVLLAAREQERGNAESPRSELVAGVVKTHA